MHYLNFDEFITFSFIGLDTSLRNERYHEDFGRICKNGV